MKIKLFKIFKYFKDIVFWNREKYNKYYEALKKFYPEYYLSINNYEEDDVDEEIEGTNLETEKFQYFKNSEIEKLRELMQRLLKFLKMVSMQKIRIMFIMKKMFLMKQILKVLNY